MYDIEQVTIWTFRTIWQAMAKRSTVRKMLLDDVEKKEYYTKLLYIRTNRLY